jgi:hypothetical protein
MLEADTERRIAQLETDSRAHGSAIGDLETVVMGPPPNRDNGIRGDLKDLKRKYFESVDEFRETWNVRRREECLGLEAVGKLREEIARRGEEDADVQVAKIQSKAQVRAARWQALAQTWGPILTFAGVLFLALKK